MKAPKISRQQVLNDADAMAQMLSYALTALDIIAHEPMQCEYFRTEFAHKVYNTIKPLAGELVVPLIEGLTLPRR